MRKIKWGVIGAGGIADRRTLPGMMLADNCELIGVMEVNPDLSQKLAEKYGAKYAYTSAEELLDNEEIEAVYIASPVAFHKTQVMAAAQCGKHVLCEKPIAITLDDSKEAYDACCQSRVLSAAGFMMRYHSLHKKMKELVAKDKLGQIVSCRLQMSCWFPFIEGNWRQQRKNTGGGALMDMGIHCIDLAEYILDDEVCAVSAFCDTKTFAYDIDDSANVMLKTKKGSTIYIDVNYNIPDDAVKSRIEIFGTKGSAVAEGTVGQTDTGVLRCVFADQEEYVAQQERTLATTVVFEAENANLYTKELASFANSIANGTQAEVSMLTAIRAQQIVEAAYEASESGKTIHL